MKKILFTLIALVSVLSMLMIPSVALADTTVVGGTLDVPTITSITPNSGVQGNTYAGVSIVGTYLTGAAVTLTGTAVDTITASAVVVAGDGNSLTCTIAIPTNAPTSPVRDVVVVATGGTVTKTAAFTVVASTFGVAAPAGFSLGAMVRNQANKVQGPNGLVTTNAQNWQVQATGSASNSGFMWNGSASPTLVFQIGKSDGPWTDASATLTYTQADPKSFPFWAQQTIDADDPPGTYSITITFTGSQL